MFQKKQCTAIKLSTISDYLPQVLFIPSIFLDNPATKSNIFERIWKNFIQAEFVMDYFDKDWSNILNLKQGNVNGNANGKFC